VERRKGKLREKIRESREIANSRTVFVVKRMMRVEDVYVTHCHLHAALVRSRQQHVSKGVVSKIVTV
jgi:hypothetical protein